MSQLSKRTVRILWFLDYLILLAALLPGVLGHPYPRPIRPYIGYGGILLYTVGALALVIIVGIQKKSAQQRDTKP